MSPTAVLPEAASTLLTALFPDDLMREPLRINLRGLVHGGTRDDAAELFAPSVPAFHSDGHADTCLAWNRDQARSVYVAPGVRRGRDGTKNGVVGIMAFWADLDAKAFLHQAGLLSPTQRAEGKRLAQQRLLERLPAALQPSIIIDTGGGLQCWWLFKEPAWLGGDNYTIETLEGYLRGLATALGGDPAVTHLAALMRLPGFANRKYQDDPIATIVTADLARRFNPSDFIDYYIESQPSVPHTDAASDDALGPLAPVLATCGFLQWCRDHPADVPEPLWYAMCSNLVRLEGGRAAAHDFSRGYPGYTAAETDRKLDQALAASGPYTCEKIQALGFTGCPPDGHGVKSPAGLAWKRVAAAAADDAAAPRIRNVGGASHLSRPPISLPSPAPGPSGRPSPPRRDCRKSSPRRRARGRIPSRSASSARSDASASTMSSCSASDISDVS
jgi:RepB DNA-primase from phage plasmid